VIAEKSLPLMPPLLDEELTIISIDNGKLMAGTSCENIVKGYLLANGKNVAEPNVDSGVDILVEMTDGWKTAQVKKIIKKDRKGHIRFNFPFQPIGSCRKKENGEYCSERVGPEHLDYFYHVLLTPLRQLIWQIPSYAVGLREDGTFRTGSEVTLDKVVNNSKSIINFHSYLVSAKYDVRVFDKYSNFFKPKTLNNFIME
jgi:hypothetical protein